MKAAHLSTTNPNILAIVPLLQQLQNSFQYNASQRERERGGIKISQEKKTYLIQIELVG
jgi:hypothetical protein